MTVDLRPPAILSVGVTGHRNIGPNSVSIEEAIATILTSLREALFSVVRADPTIFSEEKPKIRFITMAAEGADQAGTSAALRCSVDVAYILPFHWNDYCADFKPENIPLAEQLLSNATSLFVLPGRREEGARAYERANEVILENIDLLIAVWDGGPAKGRAGTGDVVQRAVTMGRAVVTIDPKNPTVPTILDAPSDQNLALSRAEDLASKPLPGDLASFVGEIVGPPRDAASRHAFRELLAERPGKSFWRYEYRLLFSSFAKDRRKRERLKFGADVAKAKTNDRDTGSNLENTTAFIALGNQQSVIDKFAVDYGQLFRSTSVSKYLLVIVGAAISSMAWLLVPWLSSPAIAVQALFNGLVLLDAALSAKHRWHEKWLEYRVIAQRLLWVRVFHSIGLGVAQPFRPQRRGNYTLWMDWYVDRSARGWGPPAGLVDTAYLSSATDQLQEYIKQQVAYHRATFRGLGLFEARLSFIAAGTLIGSIFVAIVLGIAVARNGGLNRTGWEPLAIILLTILPATMTAMNGIRAEVDLVRLTERSSQTIVLLTRINRALSSTSITYDRLSVGARRLIAIMGDELDEWRFVLESRRSHKGRKRRSTFRRFWRRFFS